MNEFLAEHVAAEEQLALELRRYVGLWVAVENHAVVACSETLSDLLDDIRFDGRIDTACVLGKIPSY
jgi:hypothetical protein